jgi:excinuclease ABC subunit A
MVDSITIKNARLHNLKNVTVSIPKNKLVVLTGLSGSGKSTLAFDTLHREGQRQYMESLGLITDALSRPPVDAIEGLSPSISVGQHLTNRSPRSTVGTATEVYTYLRVLYARIGHRPCPNCEADVPPSYDIQSLWDNEPGGDEPGETASASDTCSCPTCGTQIPQLTMAHFSFNTPVGACPTCTGLGTIRQGNLEHLFDQERSIADGGVSIWNKHFSKHYQGVLKAAARYYGLPFNLKAPIRELGPVQRDLLLYGVDSLEFRRHYPDVEPPRYAEQGCYTGIMPKLLQRHEERIHDYDYREEVEKLLIQQVCPSCRGDRLKPESQRVTVAGQPITALLHWPLTELRGWLDGLSDVLSPEEETLIKPILLDVSERTQRLIDVGVGYLTMDRSSPTLSGGEAQRLRLAALLGSGLTGVLYVLDEPTVGLHSRDTVRLVNALYRLRDLGNTVLVVEHDLEVIRAADYIVDMGPGGGEKGGRVVATGSPESVAACPDSMTGRHLSGQTSMPTPERRRQGSGEHLLIKGAREHNLKNITARLPLGTFIVVTGVSGSGKSTLVLDILDRAARQHFHDSGSVPGRHDDIEGWQHLNKVVTVDQTAIARMPRSNAGTYTGVYTPIRQAFAATDEARRREFTAKHFSFNTSDGACERCKGKGLLTVNMHFLPEVQLRCPSCLGRRFKPEVLTVRYRGYTIAQVLNMAIEEVLSLFQDVSAAADGLSLLVDVGLGYLKLGQPATTLSGGEAQRIKLAKELGRRTAGRTLYLLDEPTTGLHAADVAQLLAVLQRLVDAGNTVVVIEHNVGVIRTADWIIDLGPEGGEAGGWIVAEGTPEQVSQVESSYTGMFLSSSPC